MFMTDLSLFFTYALRLAGKGMPLKIGRGEARTGDAPYLSVVIPCYNQGQYVDEAVDSLLQQTWQNFEIIIVNDGSTDEETNRILSSYQRPKTRVLNLEKNVGLPAARNAGICEARGRYICCLDADDKFQETYLEKALVVMEINAGISFVWAWTQVFGSEDRVWYAPQFDPEKMLFYNQLNSLGVFRRIAWEKAGGFYEVMRDGFEDWEYWVRLTGHGFRGHRISEKLILYRRVGYSFAQRAAEKKEALFTQIKENNAALYADPQATVKKLIRSYCDVYSPAPYENLRAGDYLQIPGLSRMIVSSLNSTQTLEWLQHHSPAGPFIWIAQKALDEEATDALYAATPYVYILPNFIPQYARNEFIRHLGSIYKTARLDAI